MTRLDPLADRYSEHGAVPWRRALLHADTGTGTANEKKNLVLYREAQRRAARSPA
jgi:hypothetical protein